MIHTGGFFFDGYGMSFPFSYDQFGFIKYYSGYPSLLLKNIGLEYIFLSFYPKVIPIPDIKVYFMDASEEWILF